MESVDFAYQNLEAIQTGFSEFVQRFSNPNEADTRAELIDRILTEVLLWPRHYIKREEYTQAGVLDYYLQVNSKPYVAVEAKKEGLSFALPVGMRRRLRLNGCMQSSEVVREAVKQVRGYCDEHAIRYGVATNGSSWVVFRAIRDDMPWRDGLAVVFKDLADVKDNFLDFWNLLSFAAISEGSLETSFSPVIGASRQLHRVIALLRDADIPLQRNRLHAQLNPLILSLFQDIADQEQVDILRRCYVHSKSLKVITDDLSMLIRDTVPRFLQVEGTQHIYTEESSAGVFGATIRAAAGERRGQLFLLLGGIGCGKTTFLKRYFRTIDRDFVDQNTVWFYVDFLRASPTDPSQIEGFIWGEILASLRERYQSLQLESRRKLHEAFRVEIDALEEVALRGYLGTEYDRALASYFQRWQADPGIYVPHLLKMCFQLPKAVLLFVDNVDQLPPHYQAQIFQISEAITRRVGTLTIVSLREESYYVASLQKSFTAYSNCKFHVASPDFRALVAERIRYANRVLQLPMEEAQVALGSGIPLAAEDIRDFLNIVQHSIFHQNRNIARFIEAICFGNMRLALQMFTTFLLSGATDVDKMLRIYRREGNYFVAFHEFVRSVMLGDRKYYKEDASFLINLFEVGTEPQSSHLTALRLLNLLWAGRQAHSPEGQGYQKLTPILYAFDDAFNDEADVRRTADCPTPRKLGTRLS